MTLQIKINAAMKRVTSADDSSTFLERLIAKLKSSQVNLRPSVSFSHSTLLPFDWDDGDDVRSALQSEMGDQAPKTLCDVGGDEYVEYPQTGDATGEYAVRVNYADAYIIVIHM